MKQITIYSTPTCHYCHLAKQYLTANNIAYTEYNVASDAAKRSEMMELTGQLGVPVIRVDDDVLVGFQESKMAALLGLAA